MPRLKYQIAVLGLWHLGEIYSAGLAELGHLVTGISEEKTVIANFSKNIPPLPEPQLEQLIAKNRSRGTLRYTEDLSATQDCNVLWFTLDTPVNDDDRVDLSPVLGALRNCLPYLKDGVLVVVSSQIPVGTSRRLLELIKKERPGLRFDYAYAPENLRLGEAVKCFMEPGRVVVGVSSDGAFENMKEIFSGLRAEMVRMSPASAEVSKHALNAFLAASLSFMNDIADVCEKSGADVLDVERALRSDPRIGPKAFLGAGIGFSGGTLGRDLKALTDFSKEHGVRVPVIEAVSKKNNERPAAVLKKLSGELREVRGKTIAIFGLTYKPGTRTLRRSRALEVAAELGRQGAVLRLHDPAALEEELPQIRNADFFRDPYAAAEGADAVILITPWPEFKELDLVKLIRGAKKGVLFFDTVNLLYNRSQEFGKMGAVYRGIGR